MIEFFIFLVSIAVLVNTADPSCNNNTFPPHDDYSKPFTFTIPADTSSIAERRPRRSATSLGVQTEHELSKIENTKISQDDSSSSYLQSERMRRSATSLNAPAPQSATVSLSSRLSAGPVPTLEQYKQLVLSKQPSPDLLKEQLLFDSLDKYSWNEAIVETYNELPSLPHSIYSIHYLASRVAGMNLEQIEDRLNENKNKYNDNPKIRAQSLTHYVVGYNLLMQLPNRSKDKRIIKKPSKKKELNFEKGKMLINAIQDPLLKSYGIALIEHLKKRIKYSAGINSIDKKKSPSLALSDEFINEFIREEKLLVLKAQRDNAEKIKIANLAQLIEDAEKLSSQTQKDTTNSTDV